MAKRLGFQPDTLVGARPDPRQKWKLPVKLRIHELHLRRFGYVQVDKADVRSQPANHEEQCEGMAFEEQLYWEDYQERNRDDLSAVPPDRKRRTEATTGISNETGIGAIPDEDLPF